MCSKIVEGIALQLVHHAADKGVRGLVALDILGADKRSRHGRIPVQHQRTDGQHFCIVDACQPWAHQIELLQTIPGVGEKVAQVIIAEVDYSAAALTLYEGAIHMVQSEPYQVERLDWEGRKAYVQQTNVDYYTDAIDYTKLKVLDEADGAPADGDRDVKELDAHLTVQRSAELRRLWPNALATAPVRRVLDGGAPPVWRSLRLFGLGESTERPAGSHGGK